ncbi:DUF1446 domain-containing protein [Pseudomaricurvus alkylphenolicus]|uniref:acyclic terpene utilization AtuA family protein n=1 Tax=Pseudomaricurvus alkylphenolicus TaxID=1306991 RepID=UPI001423620A|nr:acyclic terpene utilization AtuA family protein [Pseudomaricurvus alkylphenolicus]NIB38137.1 DUF1446 domain-containing protein [Pseudomaricurvus alkylphenolicus]
MSQNILKIGGASGFWGDSAQATAQLLQSDHPVGGHLDYIVYDYLAEITMSLLARARAKDPTMGYAHNFLSEAMIPNLQRIARQGVKIIANAGGVNPEACASALASAIDKQGLHLKVAWVEGDDLVHLKQSFADEKQTEMFTGANFPAVDSVQSINAYLGAFPIAEALSQGADIVITGRCVDSAVTLGACIHHFNWTRKDLDQLAMGSLAGHILECGVQATGGNFTDWEQVPAREYIGYPIAEIEADGTFTCTKPENTGGLVNVGTVAEQLVYEIGDPNAYLLPDVTCDFSEVRLEQSGTDRVRVIGAKGRPAPRNFKVSATYTDQYRGGSYLTFYGNNADKRADAFAESVLKSSRDIFSMLSMPDFSETSVELLGAESQFGDYRQLGHCREVVLKIAAKHPEKLGVGIMLKQLAGLSLATPPGLSSFGGNSPKIVPVVRLFSMLIPKDRVSVKVHIAGNTIECQETASTESQTPISELAVANDESKNPIALAPGDTEVPLVKLAWGRSGDKGNNANIGIIARKAEYLPYIQAALTTENVVARFAHFFAEGDGGKVEQFLLPGLNAINFLLRDVLGGGGIASLRNDPQAKGYAQLLLDTPVSIPQSLAESL